MLRQAALCRACLRAATSRTVISTSVRNRTFATSPVSFRRHKRDIYDDQGDIDEEPLPSSSFASSALPPGSEDVLETEEGLSRLHPSDMEPLDIVEGEDEIQTPQGQFTPYSFDLEEPDLDPRYAFGIRKPRKEKPDYPAIIKLRPDLDPEVDEEELEEVKRVSQIRRQTEKKRRSKVSASSL